VAHLWHSHELDILISIIDWRGSESHLMTLSHILSIKEVKTKRSCDLHVSFKIFFPSIFALTSNFWIKVYEGKSVILLI
jgi:hypothetical protein